MLIRLAAPREQLIALFGLRAQLLDDQDDNISDKTTELFVQNMLDMLVAGLAAEPSPATLTAGTQIAGKTPPKSP